MERLRGIERDGEKERAWYGESVLVREGGEGETEDWQLIDG